MGYTIIDKKIIVNLVEIDYIWSKLFGEFAGVFSKFKNQSLSKVNILTDFPKCTNQSKNQSYL